MDAIGQGLDSVGDAFGGGLRAIGDAATRVLDVSGIGLLARYNSALLRRTTGVCLGGQAAAGWSVGVSLCYVVGRNGRSGLTATVSSGMAAGGGANVGIEALVSNARSVQDLRGASNSVSASGGRALYSGGGSISWSAGEGPTTWQATGGWTPGIRSPFPFSVTGGRSYTWTTG
jgi:hypothetical protein